MFLSQRFPAKKLFVVAYPYFHFCTTTRSQTATALPCSLYCQQKHFQNQNRAKGQMRHYISSTAESACSVCICRACVHVWEPSVTIATTQCLCKWKGSKWDLFLNEILIKKHQHGWDRALNNKCKVYSGFYHFTVCFFLLDKCYCRWLHWKNTDPKI